MVFLWVTFRWLVLAVVLELYALVRARWRNARLAAMSVVFYAWGAHSLVLLFLGSILFNYVAGAVIGHLKDEGRAPGARRVMWTAVVVDLLLLFTWKYAVFAVHQLNHALGVFGPCRLG